ncbi:MAG: hypothetical protein HY682_09080 [Chloroflexi bacterium]|nr:hypothetical protein [Chloroflexota bacterium]
MLESGRLRADVERVAQTLRLPYADLIRRTYLHLPRFAGDAVLRPEVYRPEIDRVAEQLRDVRSGLDPALLAVHLETISPKVFTVNVAEADEVDTLVGRLHYLQSVRKNSISLALRHPSRHLALGVLSISPFDLDHLPLHAVAATGVRVVSRIYTVDGLPRNAVSFFLGRAFSWIRRNLPYVSLLLTYLNRNVGFSGSVYSASNWRLFAREHDARYAYLRGNYITDRQLMEVFGTTREDRLPPSARSQVSFSQFELYPLEVWAYPLKAVALSDVQEVVICRR